MPVCRRNSRRHRRNAPLPRSLLTPGESDCCSSLSLGGLAYGGLRADPHDLTALNTISTDDAYVNGHVTFVAPRVAGQVREVLVDDNMRVKKGSILVQLDKEPYQVKLAIKQAAVAAAEADLAAAQAQVRGIVGLVRAGRFQLEHAIEDVNTKIADLQANVATLKSRKASLELARANLKRGEELLPSGGISKEDARNPGARTVTVDEAAVDQALQAVYASRVGLGLPKEPPAGKDLGDVPDNLVDNFSVRAPGPWELDPERGRARLHPGFMGRHSQGGPGRIPQARPVGQRSTKSTPS